MKKIINYLPHGGLFLSFLMLWGAQHTQGFSNFILASFSLVPLLWSLDRAQPLLQSLYMRAFYVFLFFGPALGFYYKILQYKPAGLTYFMMLFLVVMVDNRFYAIKLLKENLKKLPLFWEVSLVSFLFWCRDFFSYSLLFNETLGYFFNPDLPFMSMILPLFSASSLSFWMMASSYGVYRFAQTKKPITLLPMVLIALGVAVGYFNYTPIENKKEVQRVLVLQTNSALKDYEGRFLHPQRKYTEDFFVFLDKTLKEHSPSTFDIIIAPELSFVYPLLNPQTVEQEKAVEKLKQEVYNIKKPLIIGSYFFDASNQRANAFYVLSPTTTGVEIFMGSKQELLPYIEGDDYFKVSSFLQGSSMFGSVGSNVVNFSSFKAVSAICFETTRYYSLYQSLAQTKSGLILNLTDESDFQSSAVENFMHRGRFRALETGTTLLRVSKTGYSALISKKGQVEKSLDPGQKAEVWPLEFEPQVEGTIYGKYHGFYMLLTLFYVLFILRIFWDLWKKKNPFII